MARQVSWLSTADFAEFTLAAAETADPRVHGAVCRCIRHTSPSPYTSASRHTFAGSRPGTRFLRFSRLWNAVRGVRPFASEIEDFVMAFGPVPVRSCGRCAIMHMCTHKRSVRGTP